MRERKYKEAFKRQRLSKCKCAWLLITTVCSLGGKTRGGNVSKQVTYQHCWTLVATTFEFRHADSVLLLRRRPQTVNSKNWNCKSVTFIPSGQHTFVSFSLPSSCFPLFCHSSPPAFLLCCCLLFPFLVLSRPVCPSVRPSLRTSSTDRWIRQTDASGVPTRLLPLERNSSLYI